MLTMPVFLYLTLLEASKKELKANAQYFKQALVKVADW